MRGVCLRQDVPDFYNLTQVKVGSLELALRETSKINPLRFLSVVLM